MGYLLAFVSLIGTCLLWLLILGKAVWSDLGLDD